MLVIRSVHPRGTRETRLDPGVSYRVSAPCGPPSLPEQPGGIRESRLGPGVSYRVSVLCGLRPSLSSPEVARAPNEPAGSKHTAQQTCE